MSHTERNRETDQRVEEREKSDRIRKGKKRKRMAKREKERKKERKQETHSAIIHTAGAALFTGSRRANQVVGGY